METEKMMKGIAKRLKKLRKERGLTQSSLIEKVGEFNISLRTYKSYEKGEALPFIDKIALLADFFGVTVDYLIKGESSIKDDPLLFPNALKMINRLLFSGVMVSEVIRDENHTQHGKHVFLVVDKETNSYLDYLDANVSKENFFFKLKSSSKDVSAKNFDAFIDEFSNLNISLDDNSKRLSKILDELGIGELTK